MSNPVSDRLSAQTDDPASDSRPVESNADFDLHNDTTLPEGPSRHGLGVALQRIVAPSQISASDPLAKGQIKHRGGLPQGFISRVGRFGRTILFEDNVYRLPNGLEFIPQQPSGALGGRNHQYALLTWEQFEQRKRGSVYLRNDGRIFDYASDHGLPERELFDTGFTIHDLERTGRYAPKLKSKIRSFRKKGGKKSRAQKKRRS